jgi:hypothetical protein
MAEGAQCGVCFAGVLALQAGMLVCDACGSISQASAVWAAAAAPLARLAWRRDRAARCRD